MSVPPDPAPGGLDEAARLVGDRWTPLVLDALRAGPHRYGELEAALGGIAPNVLARRLRTLEADGIVVAVPYQRRPLRSAYELTETGRDLAGALDLLRAWGAARRGEATGAPHDRCGTDLEVRLWCPTCEQVVDPTRPADDLHRC